MWWLYNKFLSFVDTEIIKVKVTVVSDSVWPHRRQPPGSPTTGILQARTVEWVAISFSNAGKWKVKVKSLSRVWLFATPWTAAYQSPPSMGFSRQEYWSGVPLPSPSLILWVVKLHCKLNLQPQKYCYIKVKALIKQEWGTKKWDVGACVKSY